ncbi:uncharacterized protein LOC111259817 isoform X4 [Varroa jacobsoni]|uniref:uncharacterized protein LOC111259817 isoform X4 n=1 Tax=Varroa jacobsoni TaxID=62625 RepID=UPI000BF3B598|nr:uncharacterized protein LOC111259817 isoform X4 [Varroa jacobsoni]
MKHFVVLSMVTWLAAATPTGLLGEPGAIYGRLQRNSYVPYPKPDYNRLYLALKNARLQDQEPEPAEYDYEPSRPIGAIFEPQDEVLGMQYEDGQNTDIGQQLANQQWLDIGTLYDAPIDEERLEQQKESMRQFMNSYVQKKSDLRKKAAKRQPSVPAAIAAQAHAGSLGASTTMSVSTSTSTTSTTVAPARNAAENEEKVAKASKLHGQKEYAMLRPAAAGETRRPLPDLWTPEDIEVQQLIDAGSRAVV